MGWPALPAIDLYAGGPAYPLSSLGVRLRGQPIGETTVLAGVFDDNPPGGPFDNDTQMRGRRAIRHRSSISAPARCSSPRCNTPSTSPRRQHVGRGPADPHRACRHLQAWRLGRHRRLSRPALRCARRLARRPGQHRHAEASAPQFQRLRRGRPNGLAAGPRRPALGRRVSRPMGAPGDRNLVDFSVNAGVTLKAPLPGRDNDTFGVGFGVVRLGAHARGFDKDISLFTGLYYPVRWSRSSWKSPTSISRRPGCSCSRTSRYYFTPGGGEPIREPRPPDRQRGRVRAAIKRRVLTVAPPSNFAVATTAVSRSAPQRTSALSS